MRIGWATLLLLLAGCELDVTCAETCADCYAPEVPDAGRDAAAHPDAAPDAQISPDATPQAVFAEGYYDVMVTAADGCEGAPVPVAYFLANDGTAWLGFTEDSYSGSTWASLDASYTHLIVDSRAFLFRSTLWGVRAQHWYRNSLSQYHADVEITGDPEIDCHVSILANRIWQ